MEMTHTSVVLDPELSAMQNLLVALEPLDDDARARVLVWAAGRYELTLTAKAGAQEADQIDEASTVVDVRPLTGLGSFSTLGELFAAANPGTNGEKALVVGYWLQINGGLTELTGQAINKELKHLGYGIANITNALDELKASKPALAIQLRKSGNSQQARKTYKVTEAGVKHVEALVRAETDQ